MIQFFHFFRIFCVQNFYLLTCNKTCISGPILVIRSLNFRMEGKLGLLHLNCEGIRYETSLVTVKSSLPKSKQDA